MIVRAAGLLARRLLDLGLLALALGAGLIYLSSRLLRWTVNGLPPTPRRDATFALLLAAAQLARTVGAENLLKGTPDADHPGSVE